jgi:DNA-binding NtrC family response regulator
MLWKRRKKALIRGEQAVTARILIVEDDPVAAEFLRESLGKVGYDVETRHSADEVLESDLGGYDLLISDIRMPGRDGLDLLRHVRKNWREMPVIMVTTYGSLETAMESFREGACDYIAKPFSPEAIRSLVHKVLITRNFQRRQETFLAPPAEQARFTGSSAAMVTLYKQLARVADTRVSVLIEGESGTGKELAARALHQLSSRRHQRFIAVHCGAIPETLLESELFGYERGAFTGADHRHDGILESCEGGTVFLDEITELPPSLQGKLLRFMQSGEIRHLGSNVPRNLDVRVVAATNRNVDLETKKGSFRADLLYRFVVRISMPPLREHREDLFALTEEILRKLGFSSVRLSPEAMERLMNYDWPGNVRELENVLQQAILICPGHLILPEHLPAILQEPVPEPSLPLSPLAKSQREEIWKALEITGWNISRAALTLGIDRKTLRAKISQYQLKRSW